MIKPADDKITLILHPPPKASLGRKKVVAKALTPKEALALKAKRRQIGGPTPSKPESQASASASAPAERNISGAWVNASADDAVAALAEAADLGPELVKAWQDAGNTAAIAAAARADAVKGGSRKAARRALDVLRARGVEIPEPSRAPAQSLDVVDVCIASFVPADNSGTTFISITQREPGGRYRVADAVIHERLGITHASSGRIAGKQIKSWQKRVQERFGTAPVEVPLAWARHRIAAARERNAESGQLLPLGLDACAALFEPVPEETPAHPLAPLEAAIDASDVEKVAAGSGAFHGHPEFRTWLPDRGSLEEMLRRVGEKLGVEGSSEGAEVDAALDKELADATDRYFTTEMRELLSSRILDSAISLQQRAGDDVARRAVALARAVRETGIVTSPPSELPFLRSFFEKGLAVLAREGEGKLRVPVPVAPAPGAQAEPSADATTEG